MSRNVGLPVKPAKKPKGEDKQPDGEGKKSDN